MIQYIHITFYSVVDFQVLIYLQYMYILYSLLCAILQISQVGIGLVEATQHMEHQSSLVNWLSLPSCLSHPLLTWYPLMDTLRSMKSKFYTAFSMGTFMKGYNHLCMWSLYFHTDLCVCLCCTCQYCKCPLSLSHLLHKLSSHQLIIMLSANGTYIFILSSGEQQTCQLVFVYCTHTWHCSCQIRLWKCSLQLVVFYTCGNGEHENHDQTSSYYCE